jgi:hypothetical protein
MAEKYFIKFPRITYNGVPAIDITKRVNLLNNIRENPFLFYTYDVKEGERPDQVADKYYKDPNMSWLVYLSNQIVDPYYQWHMEYNQHNKFITKKYGSVEIAQQKIAYYRNNWPEAEEITVSRFASLSMPELKYWDPVYGAGNAVVAYSRKKIDWILNTNKILRYTTNAGVQFTDDEIVSISLTANTSGSAHVLSSNSTTVEIRHVSGVYDTSETVTLSNISTITGSESEVVGTISDITVLSESITGSEEVYWEPVYWFDYENEKNAKNRSIRLLDSKFATQTARELKDKMNSR